MSQHSDTRQPSIVYPNVGMDLVTLGCGILICVFVPVVLIVSVYEAPSDDLRSLIEFARDALHSLASLNPA